MLTAVKRWLDSEHRIIAAVLFGSTAGRQKADGGRRADVDLHTITSDPLGMENIDWRAALPEAGFVLQVARPATGGVRKVTALFQAGDIDLVLVPADRAAHVRAAMAVGAHKAEGDLRIALNELATCLVTGYEVLKGEAEWGEFYRQVSAELPGVRMSDPDIRHAADIFLCDLVWIFQKIDRGELRAAQHLLHTSLATTNLRLLRELRLRRGDPLPSFGLGRRVEELVPPAELAWITASARLEAGELRAAAAGLFRGMQALVSPLVPGWKVPGNFASVGVVHLDQADPGAA